MCIAGKVFQLDQTYTKITKRDTLVYMALDAEMKLFLSSDVLVLALLFQINRTYKCFPPVN